MTPSPPEARPRRVGICWVDAETLWWDATNAPVCPACGEDDEGYAEQHSFYAPEVELRELQEATQLLVESLLRTSPGHLDTPAGEAVLNALAASSEEPG